MLRPTCKPASTEGLPCYWIKRDEMMRPPAASIKMRLFLTVSDFHPKPLRYDFANSSLPKLIRCVKASYLKYSQPCLIRTL